MLLEKPQLGAGAVVKLVSAGRLTDFDLEEIRAIRPNIILLAGGVDFGESEIILHNAKKLASLALPIPVVYAGNAAVRKAVQKIFQDASIEVMVSANVFPDVDVLNIEPVRRLVHEVFNRHIIHAPGMARFSEYTHWSILPTPGAVLRGAEIFADSLGDCLVFDVGGATTDVHSVTDGSLEWTARLTEPEPRAKRTVRAARRVINVVTSSKCRAILMEKKVADLHALPKASRNRSFAWLCAKKPSDGCSRHAESSRNYTPPAATDRQKGRILARSNG